MCLRNFFSKTTSPVLGMNVEILIDSFQNSNSKFEFKTSSEDPGGTQSTKGSREITKGSREIAKGSREITKGSIGKNSL